MKSWKDKIVCQLMCRSHKDGIEFKIEKCKYQGVRDITLTKKKRVRDVCGWEKTREKKIKNRKKVKYGRVRKNIIIIIINVVNRVGLGSVL